MLLFLVGQIGIWFQTNGQFISPWAKKNPWLLSVIGGTMISYAFIRATAFIATYYDGQLWPGRFIAFGSGIVGFFYGYLFICIFNMVFYGRRYQY